MRLGFIGLGQMGAPMATHLAGWPGGLLVHDIRAEACAPVVEKGARAVPDPLEIMAEADLIEVMVLDDEQVRQVVRAGLPAARAGTVIAVHSTIAPSTAEELSAEAEPYGVHVVDAPVSGGFMGAHQGRLAVFVGGPQEAVERCEEPFGRWAELVLHVGPAGAGTRAKLARNLLHFASFAAAAEAQRLAESCGISLKALARAVKHSDAITGGPGAIMLRKTTGPVTPDDPWYDILLHVRTLGEKDLTLALELARARGVETPLAALALERLADGLGVPHERSHE
ncbi:NAD(P)-dependent oxidoreductase [Streptosporangium amethystogenes]|uniref:NAD(P)-dependent oxidoreductase n=1 Tax=Streptosporangium amethystogenes TaxID=2002 RepID=UPI0004CBB10B|nr:NAD(P)-dependent oxidoreductase [Streptosporangium amethystogenes]